MERWSLERVSALEAQAREAEDSCFPHPQTSSSQAGVRREGPCILPFPVCLGFPIGGVDMKCFVNTEASWRLQHLLQLLLYGISACVGHIGACRAHTWSYAAWRLLRSCREAWDQPTSATSG